MRSRASFSRLPSTVITTRTFGSTVTFSTRTQKFLVHAVPRHSRFSWSSRKYSPYLLILVPQTLEQWRPSSVSSLLTRYVTSESGGGPGKDNPIVEPAGGTGIPRGAIVCTFQACSHLNLNWKTECSVARQRRLLDVFCTCPSGESHGPTALCHSHGIQEWVPILVSPQEQERSHHRKRTRVGKECGCVFARPKPDGCCGHLCTSVTPYVLLSFAL